MLIDVLAILHLILYPLFTGILLVALGVSLVKGNRWVLLVGPAFTGMLALTIVTHINYLEYMA